MSEQQQLEQRRVDFELTNFVGVFKNAFTKEFCEIVISQYDHEKKVFLKSQLSYFENLKFQK